MTLRRSFRIALWIIGVGLALARIVGGGAAVMVWRQTTITQAQAPDANREFESVRAPFVARPPLVEIVDPGPIMVDVRVHRAAESAPRQAVQFFNVIAFDGHTKKLVRTRAPVWWMNFSAESLLARFGVPLGNLALTVADVERYGPGVVLDFSPPGGGRVLVWVQ
jgi:hypothetical protein